jgi:hypothetical protein
LIGVAEIDVVDEGRSGRTFSNLDYLGFSVGLWLLLRLWLYGGRGFDFTGGGLQSQNYRGGFEEGRMFGTGSAVPSDHE